MIIRETRIIECYCECGTGQVQELLQHTFDEKILLNEMIGKNFKCKNCGKENLIEDIVQLIPLEFMVSNMESYNKIKNNSDLKKYLDS